MLFLAYAFGLCAGIGSANDVGRGNANRGLLGGDFDPTRLGFLDFGQPDAKDAIGQ